MVIPDEYSMFSAGQNTQKLYTVYIRTVSQRGSDHKICYGNAWAVHTCCNMWRIRLPK